MTTHTQQSSNIFEAFIHSIRRWLQNLGINIQLFNELAGDEELPISARMLAVGVLLYLQNPFDLIFDKLKFLGLIDDMLVMIIGLVIIIPQIPEERLAYYHQKYEAVASIKEYEKVIRTTLGILWERLLQFVEGLRQRTYKKKSTEEVAQSAELREELFDEALIFVANLNLDPATLDKEIAALPAPEKVIGLLASGLEKTQK